MMKGNSLKKMVSKIMALAARILPPAPKPQVEENDGLLVVNERMAVACRVNEDAEGYFSIFRFDQITNAELPHDRGSFPDRDTAIAAAWELAYFDSPALPGRLQAKHQQRTHRESKESVPA